jgi:hypothetical protein
MITPSGFKSLNPRMAHGVWRILATALGLFLLTTAGLKLSGLHVSGLPPVGWFSTPSVQVTTIAWESVLALWLLSGHSPVGSWVAAIGTFGLLAPISGYLGWIGQASCACFGVVQASPWTAFALDMGALILLCVAHPDFKQVKAGPHELVRRRVVAIARFAIGVSMAFAALGGVAVWIYGSPAAALARLRDEALTADPRYLDFGTGRAGMALDASVEVHNWTDRPVRVIGGTSDCTCVTTIGLPTTIAAGESRILPLRLGLRDATPGVFTRQVELWTDCKRQRVIHLLIGCRIE